MSNSATTTSAVVLVSWSASRSARTTASADAAIRTFSRSRRLPRSPTEHLRRIAASLSWNEILMSKLTEREREGLLVLNTFADSRHWTPSTAGRCRVTVTLRETNGDPQQTCLFLYPSESVAARRHDIARKIMRRSDSLSEIARRVETEWRNTAKLKSTERRAAADAALHVAWCTLLREALRPPVSRRLNLRGLIGAGRARPDCPSVCVECRP